MRRSDREIKDRAEILTILNKCDVCRLALARDNVPYVVPLNFGVDESALALYFHCANEGMKLDIIRANPNVCFEVDCSHRLVEGAAACNYTMEYESVIGRGTVTLCATPDEKRLGLLCLMRHYAPEREFDISDGALSAVTVLRLNVAEISGKRLKK